MDKSDDDIRMRRRSETLDTILKLFDAVPSVLKDEIRYAAIGGFAVNTLTDDNRDISDIDLVFNSFEDPSSIYRRVRRLTYHINRLKKINIDVQSLSRPIYNALLFSKQDFEIYTRMIPFHDRIVPCLSPEAIIAAKIYSGFVMNDSLRDKDVHDILLLNQFGISLSEFVAISDTSPHFKLNSSYKNIPFVLEKSLGMHAESPDVSELMIKYSRKVSRIIGDFQPKVTALYSLAKEIDVIVKTHILDQSKNFEDNKLLMHKQVCDFLNSCEGYIL